MWTMLVDLLRATIFTTSHLVGGSLGAAVIVVSALVRLALLPLMLRGARRARLDQAKLHLLEPQLARLKRRYASDPRRLMAETQAVYRANGIRVLSASSLA